MPRAPASALSVIERPVATSISVSVIVRTYNSGRTLDACLDSIRRQSVAAEIVVVDSGSTDDTLAIARKHSVERILRIPRSDFSYGRALNLGAATAAGDVHAALSSHCALPHPEWLAASVRHYDDQRVAATNGQARAPDGTELTGVALVGCTTAISDPYWGFSNHASSWRAEVWREEPFNDGLIAAEDIEWADRVCGRGYLIVFDRGLLVLAPHRSRESPPQMFRRAWREAMAVTAVRRTKLPTLRSTLTEWWTGVPQGRSAYRHRLSPLRVSTLAARYAVACEVRHSGPRRAYRRPSKE